MFGINTGAANLVIQRFKAKKTKMYSNSSVLYKHYGVLDDPQRR